jgi:excisionase family DNA binding protein
MYSFIHLNGFATRRERVSAGKLLLSPEEACELIGVGKSTLTKMLQGGQIPSFRVGRLRKIPVDGVHAFIEKQLAAQCGVQEGNDSDCQGSRCDRSV